MVLVGGLRSVGWLGRGNGERMLVCGELKYGGIFGTGKVVCE